MKRILVLFLSISLFACSDDDGTTVTGDGILNGEWTLTNVVCFCGFPDPPGFEMTTLTFDAANDEVTVLSGGSLMYFKNNGTYSYTIVGDRITLEDGSSYDFVISGNSLSLQFVDEPNIADDEILYTLIRN